MRIAIVGSRKMMIGDKDTPAYHIKKVQEIIFHEFVRKDIPPVPTLVSGGAEGVDALAEGMAKACLHPTLIFEPEWTKYGKGAAFKRNQKIVDAADKIIAITFGDTPGTADTIRRAMEAKKPLIIYRMRGVDGKGDTIYTREEHNV